MTKVGVMEIGFRELLFGLPLLLIYFVPYVVARNRKHRQEAFERAKPAKRR